MAAVTHKVSTPLTTDLSTYTSGSFTPAANDLLVCFVKASGTRIDSGNGIAKLTDSQNLGWTLIDKAIHVASADTLYCFVANKLAAASATTVTFDCTGDAATGSIIEVASVSGMTRTGRDAVRQVAKQENSGSATTPAPTFSNAVLTGNPTLGAVGNGTNPATLTPPTGWTEAADTGYATPAAGIEYVTRDSGFTGTTITWGSTSASANGCIAIELDTSTATSSPAYFISAGTAATAASGNVTPALPTSPAWAADDILLLVISAADNVVCTLPAGWTIKQATNSGTALRQTIAWRRAVAGDTAPLVTHTGGNDIRAQVLAIRSAYKSGDPITAINTTASTTTTTVTGPSITPTTNNSAIFFIGSEGFSNTSGAPTYTVWTGTDPTFIEVSDGTAVAGTLMASLGVAWGQQKTAAATGSRTATIAGEAGTPTATIGTQLSIAPASPVITQASFRFYEDGTETAGAATAAQDTNISRDVTSDSNLALRVRLQESAAYAGLSTDDYQLQYTKNSGGYVNVNDGSITVDTSYSETNYDTTLLPIYNAANAGSSQSFTSAAGGYLYQSKFYIKKAGAPIGNVVSKLYAMTGALGATGAPTGTALATSDNVDVSTLSTTIGLVTFLFTGANKYLMSSATNYCITIEYTGGDASNRIDVGYDLTTITAPGNEAALVSGTWNAHSLKDVPYYVYIQNPHVIGFNSASLTDAAATTNRLSIIDNYIESNQSSTDTLIDSASGDATAQSITGNGDIITGAKFYLQKVGAPTGNAVAKIYTHSGTFGTSSVPTGAALATSDNFSVTGIGTSLAIATFTFSGINQITLTSATKYVLSIEYSTGDASNFIKVGTDTTSPTHGGNKSSRVGGSWTATSGTDIVFYALYGSSYPTGNFVAGQISETGLVTDHQITASNYTEHLYSLTVASAAVANTDTLDFRVLRNSSVLDTYTVTPRITVSKSVGAVNASVTQLAATVTAAGGTQTVSATAIVSASVTQIAASVTATGGTQVIAAKINTSVTQAAASVTASGGTQAVASIQNASVPQSAGVVTASGGTQTVSAAAFVNVAITQLAATVTASGGTQSVTSSQFVAITQSAASVTAAGGTQAIATVNNVSVTQSAGSVVASGGTQSVTGSGVISATITQVAGTITASGGTQSISAAISASIAQSAATITASGGTQLIATQVSTNVGQSAANVTASGGTQVVTTINNVSISQVAGSVTVTGGTQVVTSSQLATISQVAGTVTASGGTATVSVYASIAQLAASVTATGGTQDIYSDSGATSVSVTQVAGSVTARGGTQIISTATGALSIYPVTIYDIDGNRYKRVTATKYMRL